MSEAEIDPGLELILPDERDDARDRWLWGAVLVILALWVFSPALFGGYLWDDSHYPLNPVVQRGIDGLSDIWFSPSQPASGGSKGHFTTPQYYPMTYTSYWLLYSEWGNNPMPEHALNLLLHAGSALLLWKILRRLKVPGAWVAAAIFAVHPMQTESVAWVSERKNVLAGVFFFGSMLTYLQFLKIDKEESKPTPEDYQWYGLSLVLFIAGLLSKSIVCSLPVVLAILIWWKRKKLSALNIGLLVPFLALGLVMASITSWFEVNIVGATGPDWNFTHVDRLLIAGHVIWFYVAKLLFPANLSFIYAKWPLDSAQWIYVIAAIAVLVALIALVKKTGRGVLAAVLIYLVTLVPAMGFFDLYPMRYSYVADHFQYFSGVALIVLAVALVAHLLRPFGPSRRIAGLIMAIGVIGILSIASWSRAHIFADPELLWRDVIAKNPTSWLAYENLAGVLDEQANETLAESDVSEGKQLAVQQANEAIDCCQKALALHKDLPATYEHWGRALLVLNKPADALEKFRKAEELSPSLPNIRNNLAITLTQLHRTTEAEEEYRQALKLVSDSQLRAIMRVELGSLLMNDGTAAARQSLSAKTPADKTADRRKSLVALVDAAGQFDQATKDNPQLVEAWFNLGEVLIRLHQNSQAFDALKQAVTLDPRLVAAHSDLGMLYAVAGHYAEAGQEYLHVVQIQSDNADAYANMGLLAIKLNRPTEAKEFFQSALKFDPKNAKAKEGLAELARSATRPAVHSTAAPATHPTPP